MKRIYITKDEENIAYKIFPQRMEEVIEECNLVSKCGVIVVPDDIKQNIPIVFVVVDTEKNLHDEQIKNAIFEYINKKLPLYYKPREIIVSKNLPITSSQKIDYKELEKIYASS